jgi:hypothetical protein
MSNDYELIACGRRTDGGSLAFWMDLGLRSPSALDRSEISQHVPHRFLDF